MSKLKAQLRPNLLTQEDPNDFVAIPVYNGSMDIAGVVEALKKEGMEFKTETAIDIITRFNRKTMELLLSGYSVNTGLVYMRASIKGRFYDQVWDKEKHSVYMSMNQSIELKNACTNAEVEIVGKQNGPMRLSSIINKKDGKTNAPLTKGYNAEIRGAYIKIDGDSPKNGITLRNLNSGVETNLPIENVIVNNPSKLLILIPTELESGHYELSVTTQYGKNALLKTPRTETIAIVIS